MSESRVAAVERDRVNQLESAMASSGLSIDQPLAHLFTPGIYTRMIFNPRGSLIVTRIHRIEHPFVLLRGALIVRTEDGGVERITAPHFGVTPAGTRRVIYAVEDSIFITFHPNADEERNLSKLEERLVETRVGVEVAP